MSDLLNQASLVMVPSGYKEDTVYSVVPSDGSGDLSFTRASNGTRINSAGLVEVCPWNLCEYSEDQTQWTSQNETTVTANSTTAPNGTTTADTVTPTAVNDDHYRGIGLSSQVGELTAFIYVKPNGYNFFDWGIWNGSQYIVRATFDLVNLTYTFTNAGTATIESVGNGWLKCGISGTNASLSPINLYYRSRPTGGTGAFTGDGTSGAFIWGAQLNIGSIAKPYFPTTDLLNVPRLTYQNGGGGCPSLLLEKQSTNLVTYSEQFDDAAWVKQNVNVTANNTTSPDGTQNADKLIANTTNSRHLIYQALGVGVSTYTFTTYAKAGGNSFLIMRLDTDSPEVKTWFNLSNGTIGTSEGGSPSITSVGNGWYRCSVQFVSSTSQTIYAVLYTATTDGITDFAGNGTDGTFAWGAQVEASSYATSYIPTTSSSATRVADLSTSDTIQTAQTFAGDFTIFADFVPFIDSTDANGLMILGGGASGLGTTYQSYLWFVGSNVYLSGDGEVNIIQRSYSMVVNQRVKIALTRVGTTVKMFVNGAQVGASNTSSLSITIRSIGWSYNLPTYQTKGKINQILLSATGASDADAISLTTI